MFEIFVDKALIRDVFYLQKKYLLFKPAALIYIREVKVVYHLKKIRENPIGK